ncbi:MAG: PHP-associated domain-containing protein [Promethearchaeota archaeon]
MRMNSFDVHMHTHHSYDSLLTPRTLVRTATKAELSAIVVTDHNTTRGGFACREASKTLGLELDVHIGAEIKTEYGDVIGLFLNEEIRARRYHEVIDEISAQDGVVYLPHPYADSTHLKEMDLTRIQVLEAYNGRNNRHQNEQAFSLGRQLRLPVLGGSDSHLQYELGTVRNITDIDITDVDELRRIILDGTSSIQISPGKKPILPRFKMTQYMSWIRSHQSERIVQRFLLFLQRQTKQAFSFIT